MNTVRGASLISIIGCLFVCACTSLLLTCCSGPQTQHLGRVEPQSGALSLSPAKPDIGQSQQNAIRPGTMASGDISANNADRVTIEDVAAIAKKVDSGFEDGWIAGREARVFKSPYRTLSAQDKAQFALAYHDFLEPFHQDLGNNLATYVPYKTRAAFARKYWLASSSGEKFKNEKEKYQIAWMHESLLDGSELWWRAAEKRFGNKIDSVLALVHDTEQNMVSKYMEDEKTEGTFSSQMSDKSVKPESVN